MNRHHLPPGPRHHFSPGGSLVAHFRDQLGFLQNMTREYGDISYFRLGFDHSALFNHPDLIEEALVTRANELRQPQIMVEAQRVIGEVLLTAEGDVHRHQRRVLQHAFMRDRVRHYAFDIVKHSACLRDRWTLHGTVDMAQEMMGLALGIASQTLFGLDIENRSDEFSSAFNEAAWFVGLLSYIPHSSFIDHLPLRMTRHFHQAREKLHSIAREVIAHRRRSGENRGDLLSLLIHSQEGGGADADIYLRNEVLAILMAGHETTARGLAWTWYLLSQNPEAEARFHAELDSVLGGRTPTPDDVPHLPYTEMVFAESIRLFPPIFSFERTTIEDYPVREYVLPAGTTIILSPYVTQRTEQWYPDPERFEPERMAPQARASRPRFSYFPFGGGQRQCMGEPFAWTEASLVLATIGQKWKPRLVPGSQVIPEPMMTLRPRDGLPMILEPRR